MKIFNTDEEFLSEFEEFSPSFAMDIKEYLGSLFELGMVENSLDEVDEVDE